MESTALRKRLDRAKGILVTTLVLIVVLVGLEGFQRVKDYLKWRKNNRNPYSYIQETRSGFPVNDKGGSIVLVSHPHLIYGLKEGQQTPEVTINAQGFRGGDWAQKDSSSCRIIVLGGSAAFGMGASRDDKVFLNLLQRRLNASMETRVEVYNAGVPGYGSKQELILLATSLLDYDPDMILIFDGWNDFYFSGLRPPAVQEALSPSFFELDEIIGRNTQRWLNVFRLSAFFRWAERNIWIPHEGGRTRRFDRFSDNLEVYLPDYRKNLERIVRLARAYGADVVIVSQPELFHREGEIPEAEQEVRLRYNRKQHQGYEEFSRTQYPAFIEAARQVAVAEDVPSLDATAAFDEFDGVAFMDFVHFTDEGNQLLAQYLFPAVFRVLSQKIAGPGCHAGLRSS